MFNRTAFGTYCCTIFALMFVLVSVLIFVKIFYCDAKKIKNYNENYKIYPPHSQNNTP